MAKTAKTAKPAEKQQRLEFSRADFVMKVRESAMQSGNYSHANSTGQLNWTVLGVRFSNTTFDPLEPSQNHSKAAFASLYNFGHSPKSRGSDSDFPFQALIQTVLSNLWIKPYQNQNLSWTCSTFDVLRTFEIRTLGARIGSWVSTVIIYSFEI